MTSTPSTTGTQHRRPRLLIWQFPSPAPVVELAYRDLDTAANGTAAQKKEVGDPALLPRPWDPSSCIDPDLRHAVWTWLEEVVSWLNHEYTWDVTGLIPTCWPEHPHLVHEVAVVADQRRRAGNEITSDALEEWHRYCLPSFIDRMGGRLRATCADGHAGWPARSRHNQHTSTGDSERREDAYAGDIDSLPRSTPPDEPPPDGGPSPEQPRRRFAVVDRETGEICDEYDPDHRDGRP